MKAFQHKIVAALSSSAILLAVGACDRVGDQMTGTSRTGTDTSKTERAANQTKRDARDASASARASVDSAAEKTKAMGAAATEKVDDAVITTKVKAAIAADKDLSATRIDVDTQNGVVTLSGPAPTATAKERAAEVARNVKGVSSVNNQLTIQAG